MPSFRYTAITASGETTTGLMEAPSEQALLEMLRRQGSLPMRAEPAEGKDGFLPSLMRAEFLGGGGKLGRMWRMPRVSWR
jgi:type II secretory pathway component PulF